jgi:pimeloyl-ACP methyl ester carboxylesterase
MNSELGKHWILLRGLARESAHWGDFAMQLKAAFPDATLTMLDLPGTGCFHKEASPHTIQAITDAVRYQALDNGYLHQPVTLLAVSLGAMVAWEWMRNYPDDISGASLINTSFADLSPFYHRLRWQSYRKFVQLMMMRNVRQKETAILQLISNRRDRDDQISLAWEKIQNQRPISLKNSFRQIIAAARYHPGDIKPKQPVLLINSKSDQLVAPACSEKIQKKWHLEMHSHAWGGHDLTLDDPAWVALQLKNWVLKER